ncbi:oxidoreductase|nr:hypothetical protein [Candidatus Pantoea persica]MBA2814177.1 oxidoreductase [Candidatus Pantoea persica]
MPDATLSLDGQFHAPGNFRLVSSDRRHTLHWEEPANSYQQLWHKIDHLGQSLPESPTCSLTTSLLTLCAM